MGSSNEFGFTDLIRGIGGMAAGTVTYTVLATPRIIRRLPRALHAAYSMTSKAKAIGPNLKGVIYVLLPVGALLIVPLSPVVIALAGAGVGVARGVGRKNVIVEAWHDTRRIDEEFVKRVIPDMYAYAPDDLEEGKSPFDISPLRGLKSLLTGIGGAAYSLVASGLIVSRWMLPNIHRKTWNPSKFNGFEQAMVWSLVTVVWVLTPALGLLGGAVLGLVQGCRYGYTNGFRTAFRHLKEDHKKLHEFLKETVNDSE
jgi:hypothetical protein